MGIWFFILQLSYSLAFASDNLVAAQVLGPVAVSTYSVVQRMFSVASLMVGIVLVPLWPAYGEAIARGDNLWVKRMLIQSMVISLAIVGILSMVFVVFGAQIIRHWVGSEIVPSFSLLIGFGVWTILFALGNVAGTFLNAANALKFQVSAAVLTGIVSVILKIFFAKSIGLPGIVWGTILGYALFSSIPTLYYVPRLLSGKA